MAECVENAATCGEAVVAVCVIGAVIIALLGFFIWQDWKIVRHIEGKL